MRWSGRLTFPGFDDDDPPDDAWTRWGWGVTAPAVLGLLALRVAMTAHATWPGRHGWATVNGTAAEGIALPLIGLAAFWHSHYFWLLSPRWHGFAQLGKLLGVLGIAAGILLCAALEFQLG